MAKIYMSSDTSCDIMRDGSKRILKKMDSQIPIYIKMYSDIYREYTHVADDFFKSVYALEQAGFTIDNTPAQEMFKTSVNIWTNTTMAYLDNYEIFLKWYAQTRILGIKSMEQAIHSFSSIMRKP